VLLTAGAAEAFVLIARACTPTHAVVVHPQFTEPELALRNAGHAVDRVVLPAPFVLDAQDVPETADLVVLGNPTNPTSVLHPADMLEKLARPGRLLVVDEAFADAVPGESQSLAERADLPGVLVVRSLTKTWGLAGLRVGYVLAAPDLIARLATAQPPWAASAPAIEAAVACSAPAAVDEAERWAAGMSVERSRFVAQLGAIPGVEVTAPPSGPFVLVRLPASDLRDRLRARGWAVRSGSGFPGLGPDWIRVAVRDRDICDGFVAALGECL
jgi:histidinol-phosphate aminotransferase